LETTKQLDVGGDIFHIAANEKEAPLIERHFAGHTKRDLAIKTLPIPQKPFWLNLLVWLIRCYQKRLAHKLGNRCVFDPSCSHYAELAFRKKGFFRGLTLTLKRLHRCRPGNGGVDELT
jgi:uncharacterized protein